MIGLVIMGMILVPLFALMVASVFDPPRSFRVAGMFTTVFLLQIVVMLMLFAVIGWILSFIVPQ
ncbi:hypothetical protein ACFLYX_02915 [Chloroflexota bacterium]